MDFGFRASITALDLCDGDRTCSEQVLEIRFPIPFRSCATTVKVECRGAVFGIGVTREMRFGEGDNARHSGRSGEFVPDRTNRFETEILDDALKQIAQQRLIPQALGFTVRSFD